MAGKLTNGQFEFHGRLEEVKKIETQEGIKYLHKFLIPSGDEYTSPTQLFVGSPRQICDLMADATVVCSVYGWSRKRNGLTFQNHALEEVL